MRISTNVKLATVLAASIMAIASSVYAADGGRNNGNGCAVGSSNEFTCPSQFGK